MPRLQLFAERARTAVVFLQQSHRRLSHLRRTRHPGFLRSRQGWWRIPICRWPAARCAAGIGATPTIFSSFSPWRGTPNSISKPPSRACRRRSRSWCCSAARMSRSSSSTSTARAARSSGSTPSRASSEISSGATRKRNRRRCAKSWPSTASSRACPDCLGTRLNRAARNVFIDGRSVPEVSSLSVEKALEFFGQLKLSGWRGEIAVKIVKEIGDRLGFLGNVGLGLSHLEPQRRHPLGRRGAAHPARQPDRLRAGRRHVHPRRTLHRPAPARQPKAARHPREPARPSATP